MFCALLFCFLFCCQVLFCFPVFIQSYLPFALLFAISFLYLYSFCFCSSIYSLFIRFILFVLLSFALLFACHLRFIFWSSFACGWYPDFLQPFYFGLFLICYICATNITQIGHALFMGVFAFLRSSKPSRGWSFRFFRMVPKVVVRKIFFKKRKI